MEGVGERGQGIVRLWRRWERREMAHECIAGNVGDGCCWNFWNVFGLALCGQVLTAHD